MTGEEFKDEIWNYGQLLVNELSTNEVCCVCGKKKYQVLSKYFGEVCEGCILKAFNDAREAEDE